MDGIVHAVLEEKTTFIFAINRRLNESTYAYATTFGHHFNAQLH